MDQNSEASPFLMTLRYILADKNRIIYLSDKVFESVDFDNTGFIESNELDAIIQSVTEDMKAKNPNDSQYINSILEELNYDQDSRISKKEFIKLIEIVLKRMEENESCINEN